MKNKVIVYVSTVKDEALQWWGQLVISLSLVRKLKAQH